jgi:hypothetical protein
MDAWLSVSETVAAEEDSSAEYSTATEREDMRPVLVKGVEAELDALFRDFVKSSNGKVVGIAAADGAGHPLAAHFSEPVDVPRLCSLTARMLEAGAIVGECVSIPEPTAALFRAGKHEVLIRTIPVLGGPLVTIFKGGDSDVQTRFRKLVSEVDSRLTPPAPPPDN